MSIVLGARPRLAALVTRGLGFRVRVDEAATVTARLEVARGVARSPGLVRGSRTGPGTPVAIGRGAARLTGSGTTRIAMKLAPATRQRLRSARRLTATLRLTVTDLAGNTTRLSRRLRFRR